MYSIDMSIQSLWLRVLLSLGLILNGSSLAIASVEAGMDMDRALHSSPEATPGLASQPSCHEVASNQNATGSRDAPLGSQSGAPSKSQHPDCCKSGKCTCACVHAAVALPGIARMEASVFHGPILCSTDVHHVAPVLSELIRPPII